MLAAVAGERLPRPGPDTNSRAQPPPASSASKETVAFIAPGSNTPVNPSYVAATFSPK